MQLSRKSPNIFAVVISLLLFTTTFSLGIQDPEPQRLEKVKTLLKDENYAEAETLARRILNKIEIEHGTNSLLAAQILEVLIEAIIGNRKQLDDESKAYIERVVSIKEKLIGAEHPDIVKTLYSFSRLYWRVRDYSGSKPLIERALTLAEKIYGSEHIEVGNILNGHAWVYQQTSDYAAAIELYTKVLRIKENKFGPDHLEVAKVLNNLGLCLKYIQQLEKAKSCFERTLAIRQKVLGPEHKEVAMISDNLASLLHTMGTYNEAKALYERTLVIFEKEFGPEHPRVAACLNDLGYLLKDMGEYTEAIEYHERALAIREKVFGSQHPQVAYSLNNLAVVLRHIGDFERARLMLERCLKICEQSFGPEHRSVAMILNNLANVTSDMGDAAEAETYIRRAFEIQEKVLGPDNGDLVPFLGNYAIELIQLGKLDKAKQLLQRALMLQEKYLGPNHPDVSLSLINLADLHQKTGENKKALRLIERAQIITERSSGPGHPLMAKILCDYASYLWADGAPFNALEKALLSEEIVRDRLRLLTRSFSEREALAYASAKAFRGLDICLSIASQEPEQAKGIKSRVWNALIQSRGLVFDELAARNRNIVSSATPKVAALATEMAKARQNLADLVVRGPERYAPEGNYQKLLEQARFEKEQAERALAEVSSTFRAELKHNQSGLAEIKSSLPPGFALVSFVHYFHYDAPLKQNKNETSALESMEGSSYLALVLRSQDEEPEIVFLGKAEEIEQLVFDWGQEAAMGTRIPGRSKELSEAAYRTAGEPLRRKIWDPIEPYLKGIKGVLLVPEGSIHTINFASLPIGSKNYLIEKGPLIHYLSTERDLAYPHDTQTLGTGLLALGNPAFAETSLFAALSPEDKPKRGLLAKVKSFFTFRGLLSECENFKSLEFKSLPATEKEVNTVANMWKKGQKKKGDVLKLSGAEASELAFKMAAPGKQIIHLATHGFFLEENCPSALATSGSLQEPASNGTGELPSVTGENPLLLSGLALAGASQREAAGPEEEDGILTAEEIAALDLSGVGWVILSACNTGSGKITTGEGVFGLRRAFRMAGARTLITSLWAVEDEATEKWMRFFYQALFSKVQRTAESVRMASLEILRELKKRGESTHPFYWAGFVASGEWR